jgi:prepilin-type N-terminal cleavage/methylation domain-containing protein
MRINRAFTLIEVMVVLSILAIIAILAYNFFGNTMKEARLSADATKIYNDLTAIATAYEKIMMETGSYIIPTGNPDVTGISAFPEFLNEGGLKAIPAPPASGEDLLSINIWPYAYGILAGDNVDLGGPTVATDPALNLPDVDSELCDFYNEKYSEVGLPSPSSIVLNVSTQCVFFASNNKSILYQIYVR